MTTRWPASSRRWAALAWGYAEATLFFLVPDVLLSWVALRDPRAAGVACFWALAGALLGGATMYAWGAADPGTARVRSRLCQGFRRKSHDLRPERAFRPDDDRA